MERFVKVKDVKQLLGVLEETNGQNYGRLIRVFREQLDDLPTITITRCKDCQYFSKYNDVSGKCMREFFEGATLKNDGFCHRGYE